MFFDHHPHSVVIDRNYSNIMPLQAVATVVTTTGNVNVAVARLRDALLSFEKCLKTAPRSRFPIALIAFYLLLVIGLRIEDAGAFKPSIFSRHTRILGLCSYIARMTNLGLFIILFARSLTMIEMEPLSFK